MRTRSFLSIHLGAWALVAGSAAPALAQLPARVEAAAIGGAITPVLTATPVADARSAPYAWRGHEAAIEEYLRTAPVTHFKKIPVGITKPRRGYFEPGGPVRSFAWKALSPGILHGKMESYRSEIAAYLLSRHLGMDMVPPVVERRIGGVRGAAVYWIDGVRPWNPEQPPTMPGAKWSRQTSRMLMFDQLIGNIDRNQGNLLYDDEGHLYLIDHSRAFVLQPNPGTIKPPQQFDRALWERMAALTREELDAVLRPWLDGSQITAVLKRRDAMQKYIERHVRERGDAVTFLPRPAADTIAP